MSNNDNMWAGGPGGYFDADGNRKGGDPNYKPNYGSGKSYTGGPKKWGDYYSQVTKGYGFKPYETQSTPEQPETPSRGESWRDAKEKAQSRLEDTNRGNVNFQELERPNIQAEESFNNTIDQSADVQNQTDTTIGNNNSFGPGSSVGNNNAVTIISQGGQGLNNMQSVAAYKALNNNDYEKSYQRLNGYGRSDGAVQEAERQLGVVDRVANIYNMTGQDQKYWKNSSYAHQADYLGDIWKEGGFKYQMPGEPKQPEDKTQEIADGMDFDD